ncbi:MAG TPA: hypothetical protein PLG20_05965 [Candidatus Syntrophosphaera sp.]|jgi:ABC-type microcin C transport system permease subunit YejB|nr:hypothetical protein [Candidatus Syntrophosphaera sp.]
MTTKRFIIACLMGILAGLVCVLISGGGKLPLKVIAHIFTSRALIGFVIGISGVQINWALHGLLMGLIVSVPSGFSAMMNPPAQFTKWTMFIAWIVMGAIYGFLTELVTSVVFKAKYQNKLA